MLPLEDRLQQRFPHWFRGRRARVTGPLLRRMARWSRLPEIDAFLARNGHLRGFAFLEATLRFLSLRYAVDAAGLGRIPARGGLLVVANHPSGALDSVALLHAVGRVRRDVRIVANEALSLLEPLAGLLLPVRVFGEGAATAGVRAIGQALREGQCVIVFPAGEVSRLGPRGVRDGRWKRGFADLARRTGARVLPVRVDARNSALFYGASALCRPAATALLAREMFARRARPLRLHVGMPIEVDAAADARDVVREVRRALYALGRGHAKRLPPMAHRVARVAVAHAGDGQRHDIDASSSAAPAELATPLPVQALRDAIAGTELLGATADGKQIRLATLGADAPLLLEIGRLRELTFRRVGEGTGRARDLDRFDPHYQHVLVWDDVAGRIAGAYRIERGAPALARAGLAGLYTASLFRYADDAIPRLAQGMELGRSFVVPDYWNSRSLDYLWQGIGVYLARHPRVRYLFGTVSISAALPLAAREQIVAYYARHYGCDAGLARAVRPFACVAAPPDFGALDAGTAFEVLKANLAAIGIAVPVLYRQYTELCEPGGARFLGFGVDPEFSDSIDGLIEVDLERLQPHKRQRYLAKAACA